MRRLIAVEVVNLLQLRFEGVFVVVEVLFKDDGAGVRVRVMLDRVARHAEELIDDLGAEFVHFRKLIDIAQHVVKIAILQAFKRVALAFDVGHRRLGVGVVG